MNLFEQRHKEIFNVTSPGRAIDDVTNSSSSLETTNPFSEEAVIFCAVVIFFLLLVGCSANLLTMMVIYSYKELNRNVFIRFLFSLCVSDLISSLNSWLFLYRRTWGFNQWDPLPDFLCKIYWALDITTSYVTALHILSFAILRLISIQRPIIYKKITIIRGNIWMTSVWLICVCSALIPCLFIFGSGERNSENPTPYSRWPVCTAHQDQFDAYILYQQIGYTIFFFGPTIGVVITCIAVVISVALKSRQLTTSSSDEKLKYKRRRAVVLLLLIILSFLVGFVPFAVYEFWSVQDHPDEEYYRVVDYWFGMIAYFLLRTSECLNPLFYNIGSPKVYRYTKLFLKTKFSRMPSYRGRRRSSLKPRDAEKSKLGKKEKSRKIAFSTSNINLKTVS